MSIMGRDDSKVLNSTMTLGKNAVRGGKGTGNHYTWRNVLFFLLVVVAVLVPTISGLRSTASAENYGKLDISNFRLWINNVQIPDSTTAGESDAPTVKDGDKVKLALDWSVVNNQTDESGQKIYDFTAKINTNGITLNKYTDSLYIDGTLVGSYEVDGESFSIHLDEQAVANKSNLCGGALLDAEVSLDGDDLLEDGSLHTIEAGDKTFKVIYNSGKGDGTVTLTKSAVGSIVYEDGTYYQNYTIQLNAKGQVSDIRVTDTSSDVLSLDKDSLTVAPSDGVTVDADAFELTFPDNKKKSDSVTYTINYRMAISDAAMDNFTKAGNNVKAEYEDKSGTPKTVDKTVYITPSKPTISKSANAVMGDQSQGENPYYVYTTYTIEIDLGARAKELTEEEKNNLTVTDTFYAISSGSPPYEDTSLYQYIKSGNVATTVDGVTKYKWETELPFSLFKDNGDGVYTYQYRTLTHIYNCYIAFASGSDTVYKNTASTTIFDVPLESSTEIDIRDLSIFDDMMVKQPVSITYVDAQGNEQVSSETNYTATTYDYALVEWQITVDFGKIPDYTVSGPTQWTSFVISDDLCDTSGVYNGYHKFNCTCTNGHNPGTCPNCTYCSNGYMSLQIVDADGNVVNTYNINELYYSPFYHNAISIDEDSWSMNVINTSGSYSSYSYFAQMVSNGYKLIINYKTIADTEAIKATNNVQTLFNSATLEASWCGKTIIESGIVSLSHKPDDNYGNVNLKVVDNSSKAAFTNIYKSNTDKVTIGEDTYSYTYDNYIGWFVRVNKSELAEGDTLVIHDTPGTNLSYVEGSAVVYDGNSANNGTNVLSGVSVTTNSDGSVDFDFGKISSEMLSNEYTEYIFIYYQTKLDEEVWYQLYDADKRGQYTNSATASYNGGDSCPKVTSLKSVSPPEVVDKSGLLNQDNNKQIIAAEYTIVVNKNASDLALGGKTLQVVDTMDELLVLNEDSVKVYKDSVSEGNIITNYTMDYDKTTNKITFVVPNKTHIIITYDVKIDVDPIDNPLWYLNTNNTVQVEIFATNRKNSSVSFSDDAAAIKVWAYDTNGDITIYKYWNNGGTMTALPGATFRLYSVYDNNGHTYTEADADYIIRDDITITESDGKINITGLPLDRIYRLEEVSAPDGYSKGEDYYFVLQGHYGVTIPEALADKDIALYTSGDIIRYENKKSGSLIITKTINGDITASEVLDKISFKVTDSTGKTVKEFKLSDKKVVYDENSDKYIMKLEGLDSGTYTVEETAENADGKKVTVRYTVAGGSESSADDTENEPVLWQAGNKAAGVSVREGEETEVDFENTYESVTIATEPDASTTTTTEVTTTEITTTEVTTTEIVTTEVDTPGEDTTEVTTERTDTPSTGDSAPLMPIIIIFFVSWAAGATLIVLKRKHIK